MKLLKNGSDSALSTKAVRQLDWYYRRLTAKSRRVPDFYIPGVQKGGTTSLFRYLEMHPGVAASFQKEPHFFCFNVNRGEGWYRAHYPRMSEPRQVGDASTHYLFYSECARRVYEANSNAKIMILLRNPADRAYSAWKHAKRKGYERRSFDAILSKALQQDPVGSLNEYQEPGRRTKKWANQAYLEHGLYAAQLRAWISVFPREQLWVRSSEEFFSNIEGVYSSALEFLGLAAWSPDDGFSPFNVGLRGDMDEAVRHKLLEYYTEPNEELFRMLGVRYHWN